MNPRDHTIETALDSLRSIARVEPWRTNKECVYEAADGSRCFIGEFFAVDGVLTDIPIHECGHRTSINNMATAGEVSLALGYPREVGAVLAYAQRLADKGDTWGAAFRETYEAYTEEEEE